MYESRPVQQPEQPPTGLPTQEGLSEGGSYLDLLDKFYTTPDVTKLAARLQEMRGERDNPANTEQSLPQQASDLPTGNYSTTGYHDPLGNRPHVQDPDRNKR